LALYSFGEGLKAGNQPWQTGGFFRCVWKG
jgi:hypothetical protein